ncbi:MAG: amidohydrolase [Silicimonas sp.]
MGALDRIIATRHAEWCDFRRDLHRYPEVGFCEYRTASRIAARLSALGYEIRMGQEVMQADAMIGVPAESALAAARALAIENGGDPGSIARMDHGMTGIVAELHRGSGPVVAMRFDIDALPVSEDRTAAHRPHDQGFGSTTEGTMHACAHDGHATIGIALAEVAARTSADWRGTLRLIFQPAEEGGRGAKPMVEAGVVDDTDWFFALHLGCELPSGSIACEASEMMFSAKWDVSLNGVAAHAAGNPENGRNALLAAAQALIALHALPRHGVHATHVNVGHLEGGCARNVIADTAAMQIELRSNDGNALSHLETRARALLAGIAQAHGCDLTLNEVGLTVGATASTAAACLVGKVADGLDGVHHVLDRWPLGGGDDAAYFLRRVQQKGGQAVYLIVGSDLAAGHHASNFDFNEQDIAIGVRLMARLLDAATQKPATQEGHPGS